MAVTHIDTNEIPRAALPGSGEFAEVLNNQICGAKNVVATLHWLGSGEHLHARSDSNTHQLLYLMEGEATIVLNSEKHQVAKGAGVYLGPNEQARVEHRGAGPLKLFHLVVPSLPR
jgi:mannose-6-phosphate isomerase-like protein (cupin superfamily)